MPRTRSVVGPIVLALALAVSARAETGAKEPDLSDVLERLERVEAELRETRAELEASRERERQRDDRRVAAEDELEAAEREIEGHVARLEEAGLLAEDPEAADRENRSGVGAFFDTIDFTGWVAGSYNFNFARNGSKFQTGQNSYALFPDANTLQLDQAWLSIDRAPTENARVGFHFDVFAGQHAAILDSLTGSDDFALYTAYASVLLPLLDGVRVDIGRLAAATGYETIEARYNTHITRGLTWQFQPVTNTGLRISTALPGGFSAIVGVVNDAYARSLSGNAGNSDIDLNDFKTVTAGVGWAGDSASVAVTGYFGRESALEPLIPNPTPGEPPLLGTPNHAGLVDVLILYDPTDRLSLFANTNAFLSPDVAAVGRFISVSSGGRYAVLDDLGLALRGEWARTEGPNFALDDDVDVWSVTATTDYTIYEHVVAKLELRYDRADDAAFFDSGGREDTNADYDQLAILAQALLGF
ncbi:MAG: outer membrane beta-barrel protein [Myxococcota bacterium]